MFGDSSERQYPLVRDLRLVLARVRWWKLSKRRHDNLVHCPIRPLHQVSRSHVRWAIRHNNRTAIGTLGLLRTDVRLLLAAREAHEITIERATAILCAEIAAEHIVAWGRPGVWRTRRFKTGIHKEIPFIFFANPHNTIQSDGWATCGWDVTVQHWADWDGPDWGDVRFRRDDVFRLFPPMPGSGAIGVEIQAFGTTSETGTLNTSGLTMDELFVHTRNQMAVRQRRQGRIVAQIRRSGTWVSLAEIADWFARERGSIEPDEQLRVKAFHQLGEALAAGEFGVGRRCRVLFLHPMSNWAKLTPERFDMGPFDNTGHSSYLRHCWIPSDLAGEWFDRRNLIRPRHLFPADQGRDGIAGLRKQIASAPAKSAVARTASEQITAQAKFAGVLPPEEVANLWAFAKALPARLKADCVLVDSDNDVASDERKSREGG